MCLRPVHFLLPVVPVIPDCGAAAEQETGNGPVPPPGRQAVRRLRCAVPPRAGKGEILIVSPVRIQLLDLLKSMISLYLIVVLIDNVN